MTENYFKRESEIRKRRHVQYDIDPLILNRWSPRAYTGESIDDEVMRAIIEAGRLAPSCANAQPWRLIYAHRESHDWDPLFKLLMPGNQEWVKNCSVLMLFLSKKLDNQGKDWKTQSFDTGAFWMSMALEAAKRGLPMHGMGGFDREAASKLFQTGEDYHVEAMAALGIPGKPELLSEKNQKRETISERKGIDEISAQTNRASRLLARTHLEI